jgi:hypothetical protein
MTFCSSSSTPILSFSYSNPAKVAPPLSFSTLAIVVPSFSYFTPTLATLIDILFILGYSCSTR